MYDGSNTWSADGKKACPFEKMGKTAVVTLDCPEVHNALGAEMIEELAKLFEEMKKDESIRLVFLTGKGHSFCVGADLRWMKAKAKTEENAMAPSWAFWKLLEAINTFPRPVVALINGAVLGGGMGLVAVCDEAIAAEEAMFGLSEVRLGLIPAVISPYVIAKIGETGARSIFLSGARFSAIRAKELGLIHRIVPLEDMGKEKERLVASYLSAAPQAPALAKSLIREVIRGEGKEEKEEKAAEYVCRMMAKTRMSQEAQEGMAAFLEKRPPRWK